MRTTRHLRTSSLLVGVLACAGCSSLFTEQPLPVGSPLRAAESSADGVRFEVYWATLPASIEADEQAALWRYVQQERLDESLRGRLARNGLRAGVVGGVPPREVLGLLDPRGDAADSSAEEGAGQLATPTGVKRQEMTVRPLEPATVNASEVTDEVDLLLTDAEGPWGETFRQVQAIYKVGVEPQPGGGQHVSLTPELHYGEARTRWQADDSGLMLRPKPSRDVRRFPELRVEAPLVLGEMLIVTSLPGRSDSRLGGFFHRAEGEVEGARKAIVVRVVQAPLDSGLAAERDESDRPEF